MRRFLALVGLRVAAMTPSRWAVILAVAFFAAAQVLGSYFLLIAIGMLAASVWFWMFERHV